MFTRIRSGLFAVAVVMIATGAFANEKVSLVLHWEHQAQFAGYYMALEKGFYAAEGLDVSIISGGADVDSIEMVKTGKADFCTTMLPLSLGSDANLALLAQVVNRSNFTIIAWKKGRDGLARIETPKDLNGKRFTLWEGFRPPYKCFLKRQQVKPEILPQYYTLSLFLHRGTDACSAMLYNEYHKLIQNDISPEMLTVFKLHEYGVDLPEDGIYCLQSTFQRSPEQCQALARASMKGWDYARDNQAETLAVVMRHVNSEKLPTNSAHMKWMLETILPSIYPEVKNAWRPGTISLERYNAAVKMLELQKTAAKYNDFVKKGAQDGAH